jgi:hypothetical protein
MNEQQEMLRRTGYNDFIGHTVQQDGRCKCGASEWPHRVTLNDKPCSLAAAGTISLRTAFVRIAATRARRGNCRALLDTVQIGTF